MSYIYIYIYIERDHGRSNEVPECVRLIVGTANDPIVAATNFYILKRLAQGTSSAVTVSGGNAGSGGGRRALNILGLRIFARHIGAPELGNCRLFQIQDARFLACLAEFKVNLDWSFVK
jgi:hypothetical protein